jgi:hypothetical protein
MSGRMAAWWQEAPRLFPKDRNRAAGGDFAVKRLKRTKQGIHLLVGFVTAGAWRADCERNIRARLIV